MEKMEEVRSRKVRKIRTKSKFLGQRLNPSNRRKFISLQKESFIENYKPKKGEEPLTKEELQIEGEKFGRKMANRAAKELKAYIKGQPVFKHLKSIIPVMTEDFLKQSNSLKEIIKHKTDEEE